MYCEPRVLEYDLILGLYRLAAAAAAAAAHDYDDVAVVEIRLDHGIVGKMMGKDLEGREKKKKSFVAPDRRSERKTMRASGLCPV